MTTATKKRKKMKKQAVPYVSPDVIHCNFREELRTFLSSLEFVQFYCSVKDGNAAFTCCVYDEYNNPIQQVSFSSSDDFQEHTNPDSSVFRFFETFFNGLTTEESTMLHNLFDGTEHNIHMELLVEMADLAYGNFIKAAARIPRFEKINLIKHNDEMVHLDFEFEIEGVPSHFEMSIHNSGMFSLSTDAMEDLDVYPVFFLPLEKELEKQFPGINFRYCASSHSTTILKRKGLKELTLSRAYRLKTKFNSASALAEHFLQKI